MFESQRQGNLASPPLPLAEGAKFLIGSRQIHTVERENVVPPKWTRRGSEWRHTPVCRYPGRVIEREFVAI